MRVTFVRRGRPRETIYVARDDGSELQFQTWSYDPELPHDLVHFVVEQELGLREGFWGRVAAGVDPARINALADAQGGAGKYDGFGANLPALLLAETVVNAPWLDPDVDTAGLRGRLEEAVRACAIAEPPTWDDAAIERTRARVAEVRGLWRALAIDRALAFEWT